MLIDNPDPVAPGATTTRAPARAKGAVWFDRLEGCWESDGKIYFDATEGGKPDVPGASGTPTTELGQIFEYDPRRQMLTLIFESPSPDVLQNPDNLVIVPQTGDILVQEDSPAEQYVRGVTRNGEIYDFVRSNLNSSEFCGGCFSPDGQTFFLNQQGGDDDTPDDSDNGITYAIWGRFGTKTNDGKREDDDHRGRNRRHRNRP